MRSKLCSPMPVPEARPAGVRRFVRKLGVAWRLARAWARVVYECGRGKYDVVVINCGPYISVAALGLLALTLVPHRFAIAQVAHNADFLNRWTVAGEEAKVAAVRRIARAAFARVDLIFVHGERSREVFERRWPVRRIAVIPHGDERLFGDPPPRQPSPGYFSSATGTGPGITGPDEGVRPTRRRTPSGSPDDRRHPLPPGRRRRRNRGIRGTTR